MRDREGAKCSALLIAVLAGLGTAHILVRTATYGAAVGTDSVMFLSTVMNFLAGEGWRDLWGNPLVGWPPLFPLLLAAFGWVGLDPLEAGRYINATALGLTILAAGYWLRSNVRSQWLALVATTIIVVSLPLSHCASSFLTDPLFCLFALLSLIWLSSFLQRGGRTPLWWGAICAALAALTRYPGVVLIGSGVLLLLVRRKPLAIRLKDAFAFGTVSSLPLAGVLTFNWAISGTLTGPRKGAGQSLPDILSRVAGVFREWAIPPNALGGFGYLLCLAAGLVSIGVGLGFIAGRKRDARLGGKKVRPASPVSGLGPALPFGAFALAYLGFIVTIVPHVEPVELHSRFLLPVYVPLLLAAAVLLDRLLSIEAAGWMVAVRYGLTALVSLATLAHIGFSARKNLRLTARALESGYEQGRMYNTPYWQHSETLNYLQEHRMEGRIYSNKSALAWFADRIAAPGKHRELPHWLGMGWTEVEAGAHIVWFDRFYSPARFGCDDLDFRLLPGVEIVAELADGTVFRRTATEPFDAERHRARKQRYLKQLLEQADEPVVCADWELYLTGRQLIYVKQPCTRADMQAKFILHILPTDPAVLPAHPKRDRFENLGFYAGRRGGQDMRFGDQCILTVRLPDYPIGRIRVGQWISAEDRTVWEAEFSPSR